MCLRQASAKSRWVELKPRDSGRCSQTKKKVDTPRIASRAPTYFPIPDPLGFTVVGPSMNERRCPLRVPLRSRPSPPCGDHLDFLGSPVAALFPPSGWFRRHPTLTLKPS